MTWNEILGLLKTSIENTAIATVKSLKEHTFKVDIGQSKLQLPDQEEVTNRLEVISQQLDELSTSLGQFEFPQSLEISNLPPPKDIALPDQMKVKGTVQVAPSSFKAVLQALDDLKASLAKLPAKPPEVKIPPFPKLPKLVGKDPKKYVPVRLTDGEEFYEAVTTAVSRSSPAFSDSQGVKTQALVDSDRHAQVDVVSMPEISVETASDDPTTRYQISDTDTDSAVKYYGFVDKDGGWYVLCEDSTAGTYRYARGSDDYSDNWDSRDTLDYGLFPDVF